MKLYSFLFIFLQQILLAQQIKVEYLEVRSPAATLKETLYIKDNKAVSIKDSLINIKYPESKTHIIKNTNFSPMYFSNILNENQNKDINFTTKIDGIKDVVFLVNDNMKKILSR